MKMLMKCIITGFEPFGNDDINPSWEVVKCLPDQLGNIRLIKHQIPTVFGKCFDELQQMIQAESPDIVICVGQAGGRNSISMEKVAINFMDARMADNEGKQPIDQTILADQPAAFFSTLPIRSMVMAMREGGIPATISYTAGTYVCNDVMYRLLHCLQNTTCIGGFIHIPYATQQAASKQENVPTMSIETMCQGLELGIQAIEKELTEKKQKDEKNISFGAIQ